MRCEHRRMTIRKSLIAVTLVVFAVVVPEFSRTVDAQPEPAATATQAHSVSQADALFRLQVLHFVASELDTYPEMATALGTHGFDARLDDYSAHGIERQIGHARQWKRDFEGLDSQTLSAANEADREWLLACLDDQLLWSERLRQ